MAGNDTQLPLLRSRLYPRGNRPSTQRIRAKLLREIEEGAGIRKPKGKRRRREPISPTNGPV